MRQVTKKEFYEVLFKDKLNIISKIINDDYPYVTVFEYAQSRIEFGRIVPKNPLVYKFEDDIYMIDDDYFLNK